MQDKDTTSMGNDVTILETLPNGDKITITGNEEKTQYYYLCDDKDILLADIDNQAEIITTYPINTKYDSPRFLIPKYGNLKLVFEGYMVDIEEREIDGSIGYIISGLPEVFVKSFRYGLGLLKEYKYIVEISQNVNNCKTLLFSRNKQTEIDTKNNEDIIVVINDNDLDKIRRGMNNIGDLYQKEALESKKLFIYNEILHNINSEQFPEKKKQTQKEVIFKFFKNTDFTRSISKNDRTTLLEMKSSIDRGYFRLLKEDFDRNIEGNLKESVFQKFFEKNPSLLTLFAGSPFILFSSQAYVGGKSFDNRNGQYIDFLYEHKITNNAFIVEIKRPDTPLLENTPYRKTGVYSPSQYLSGAVSQVLTQKYQLETDIASLIKNAEGREIEAYNVQGLLIIGLLSKLNGENEKAKKSSFELFRNNQKNLRIITYDECQEQLNFFIQEAYKKQEIGEKDA